MLPMDDARPAAELIGQAGREIPDALLVRCRVLDLFSVIWREMGCDPVRRQPRHQIGTAAFRFPKEVRAVRRSRG
jgi:hypothetical protein